MKLATIQILMALSTTYNLAKAQYQVDAFAYSGLPEEENQDCQGDLTSGIEATANTPCIQTSAESQCIAISTNDPNGVGLSMWTDGSCQDFVSGGNVYTGVYGASGFTFNSYSISFT